MSGATRTDTPAEALDPGARRWPSPRGMAARVLAFAVIIGAVLALPVAVPVVYEPVVARGVVFAIIGLSMNVILGYVGQISLGHQAFVGVGAFAAGFALTEAAMPYAVAMVVAGGIGAVAALVLGGIALRVRGMYLALVTIAFALFVSETLLNIREITGGGAGMPTPRPVFAPDNLPYIYFCLAVLVAVWLFDWRLTSSKAGRAIRALRDDERVAASWGINVTGYKLLAFVISGIVAGIGGSLFASIDEVASPITFQGITLGLIIAIMVVVGGLGSRPGVVIASAYFGVQATLLDVVNDVWGACATAGARGLQGLIAVALLWGAVAALRGMRQAGAAATVGRLVGAVVLVGIGVGLLLGAVTGGVCVWAEIDGSAAPLIGALLVLGVLIFYPGGLGQMLRPVFRWLSFRPFREEVS